MLSIPTLAAFALLQAATPFQPVFQPAMQAEEPQLSQQNRAIVRCSAAFAIVSHGQSAGNEDARKWPQLGDRGKEFFVIALAGLMDETGLDRDGVSHLVSAEAQRLWEDGKIDDVMPACLLMLESSGV